MLTGTFVVGRSTTEVADVVTGELPTTESLPVASVFVAVSALPPQDVSPSVKDASATAAILRVVLDASKCLALEAFPCGFILGTVRTGAMRASCVFHPPWLLSQATLPFKRLVELIADESANGPQG